MQQRSYILLPNNICRRGLVMNQGQGSIGFPLSEWMETATDLWLSAAGNWQKWSASLADSSRTEEYMQASLSIWQAFLPPWAGVHHCDARQSQQPSFDVSQAFMRILGFEGLSHEVFEWLWDQGEATSRGLEKFRHEVVRAWTDIYEKAIQPTLKIPQVGPAQVFQEKINRLADRFNVYQAAVSEFRILLSVPMEKSFAEMRDRLEELREKGEKVDDFKAFYSVWIKVLENHYMSLFRSEEYRVALSRLLDETAAFRITGDDVLMEFFEFLPIPTNKEMDELYKDLYTLKKQVKESAKKISKLESALRKKEIE